MVRASEELRTTKLVVGRAAGSLMRLSTSSRGGVAKAYDRIAAEYEDHWSRHVVVPQRRLTALFELEAGQHVLDLACGTGVDTCAMGHEIAGGRMVAVDCSEAMLRALAERADADGLSVEALHASVEDYLELATPESFDAVSLRFALAYFDWKRALPKLARLVRRGGRLGVLTSVATSARAAQDAYAKLARRFALPHVRTNVPEHRAALEETLARHGLFTVHAFDHTIHLEFADGKELARWLLESGYAAHPLLSNAPRGVVAWFVERFVIEIERDHAARGGGALIPLPIELVGMVAERI
jgi:ubiquinone/menaquinone biosynthesis C-methylase UbiE